MTASKLRFGLLVAMFVVLALPGTASAALNVAVDGTSVSEAGAVHNGVIEGGETVDISVSLRNAGATALTGVHATLNSADPVAVLDSADYPDLAGFATAANTTPFEVQLPNVSCGEVVNFTVTVTAGAESATLPVTVATGGTPVAFDQYNQLTPFELPTPLPTIRPFLAMAGGPSPAISNLAVSGVGQLKDIRVRLGQLNGPDIGHLVITLLAPDGTSVVLLDHRGAGFHQLSGTVFAANGLALSSSTPPYTGTFRPEGDLSSLIGHDLNGTWRLQVEQDDPSEVGEMQGWGLDLKAADCSAHSYAALTVTPTQVAPGDPATLDASGSVDTRGSDPRYAFDLDGNGTYETANGSDPTLDVSFPSRGAKHLGVQLSDGTTVIDHATVTLAVSLPPTATITHPGGLTPLSGAAVALDGSTSSDPEGDDLTYEWTIDGDPYSSTSNIAPTFPEKGTHVVRLRVTDGDGASDTAEVTVSVQNRPPTADFALSAPPAATGRPTRLDASGAGDPDGTVVDYGWDLDGDGVIDTHTATPTVTTTFTSAGTKTVGLQVTDNDEDTSSLVSHQFDVTDPPLLGALTADVLQPRPGATVTFTLASAVDPDGGAAVSYHWDFGDGATDDVSGLVATHQFTTAATVNVSVTVTDDEGAKTTATMPLVVSGVPPVAALTVTPNPVLTGATVHLNASASTDSDAPHPATPISKYRWDFDGDGAFDLDSGPTPTASTSYPNPGVVTVRVEVTDEDGHTAIAAVNLVVQAPANASGDGGAASNPPLDGGAAAGAAGADGSGGPGGASGGAGGSGRGTSSRRFTAAVAGAAIQKLKVVLKGGVAVTCATSSAARCTLRVELAGPDARRLGLSRSRTKPFVLAQATVRTDGAKAHKVTLKIARRAASKLRRMTRVTVTVAGQAVDEVGNTASIKRPVLLRNR